MVWPSTFASAPRPGSVRASTAAGSGPAARACSAMARDTGWSLAAAAAPASCSSRAAEMSPVATTSATRMWPVVTVPVLSSTIVVTRRVCSSTSGPLISTPSWAPRPVPTSSAVGVARPSAHGQATTSTATAAPKASAAPAPSSSQKASAAADSAITIGTNTAETRSASRWASALPALGCGDHAADAGDGRVRADRGRPDDQPALTVHRGAGDAVAGGHIDGHALTGQERAVDARDAVQHQPVGGDALTRPHHEGVAHDQLCGGHAPFEAVARAASPPARPAPAARAAQRRPGALPAPRRNGRPAPGS